MNPGGAFGFFVFLAFLFSILWIVAAIWVYSDASRNSSGNSLLWGLVAFFGGLVGVLLYALLGRDRVNASHGRVAGRRRSSSGGGSGSHETPEASVSHVCQRCGKRYFRGRWDDVEPCRQCGGMNVERA